jgi:hypothetical protein
MCLCGLEVKIRKRMPQIFKPAQGYARPRKPTQAFRSLQREGAGHVIRVIRGSEITLNQPLHAKIPVPYRPLPIKNEITP